MTMNNNASGSQQVIVNMVMTKKGNEKAPQNRMVSKKYDLQVKEAEASSSPCYLDNACRLD